MGKVPDASVLNASASSARQHVACTTFPTQRCDHQAHRQHAGRLHSNAADACPAAPPQQNRRCPAQGVHATPQVHRCQYIPAPIHQIVRARSQTALSPTHAKDTHRADMLPSKGLKGDRGTDPHEGRRASMGKHAAAVHRHSATTTNQSRPNCDTGCWCGWQGLAKHTCQLHTDSVSTHTRHARAPAIHHNCVSAACS